MCGPLAQLVEQRTLNPSVEGSIPSRLTNCGGYSSVWLEHQVVALGAVGSSPTTHPIDFMKTIVCKDKNTHKCFWHIKSGIVIYPADTIYGIGAFIGNVFANKKIFEIKKRDILNPFIVFCDINFVSENAYLDENALKLLNLGASVILKNKTSLPFYVSKNNKTAYRLAVNPYLKKIVKKIPLTSTSVNISTKQSLNSIKQIIQNYFGIVDVIIAGKIENIASSIVDFENKTILREGYNAQAIKKLLEVL